MRMKAIKALLSAVAFGASAAFGADVEITAANVEVVVAPDAPPAVLFAADELTNFLSQVLSGEIPVVRTPTAGKTAIALGANAWTAADGIDTNRLVRDAFTVAVGRGRISIAGRDDAKADPREAIFSLKTGVWNQHYERGTLFGVYEFLERYAGVRFYFPGELGTIVPRREKIVVSESSFTSAPVYTVRRCSAFWDGSWFEGEDRDNALHSGRKLTYTRNRLETTLLSCCHGQNGFRILRRFAKTHPEYFALRPDGTRFADGKGPHAGQLCQSSAVWDEFYKDILSYAKGEDPSVRGMLAWRADRPGHDWDQSTFRRPWIDVMPQDSFFPCRCANCQREYRTNEFHYATELVWRRTAELARRLKRDAPGFRLTQMAYTPYRRIPDIDLPDNIDVMVAEGGPWSLSNPAGLEKENAEIRGWCKKLGHKVWLWNYPCKVGEMDLRDIPCWAPRAWGRYYADEAPYIFGAYAESNCDRWLYNYLNYYVFGKVCWNPKVDVVAMLKEHFLLMYGPAAVPMAKFFNALEKKWVYDVAGRLVETSLGPMRLPPSDYVLFTEIYSPATLAEWKGLFAAAASRVAPGSLEARRIALMRREFLDPLVKLAETYLATVSVESGLRERAAHPERKNLLMNGDFAVGPTERAPRHVGIFEPKRGWTGGWIAMDVPGAGFEIVPEAPKGVARSLKLTVTGKSKRYELSQNLMGHVGHLKPNTRYRFSAFVKLDNVVANSRGGGAGVRIWDDHNRYFPQASLVGTTGWIHQRYEFVSGPDTEKFQPTVSLQLCGATGSVYFADARFEEIKQHGD